MDYGFIKAAAYTPEIRVADTAFNAESIKKGIELADEKGVELLVFPEMCITGYTCGDLFFSDVLINAALAALRDIAAFTKGRKMLVFVGLPLKADGLIYNVAAGISDGTVLAFIPKSFLPDYNEFYDKRFFKPAPDGISYYKLESGCDSEENYVPFGKNIIFADAYDENFKVAAEICEDLWTPVPPSVSHALHGATVIVNLSCSDEVIGKAEQRRMLVKDQSLKLVCGYVYANSGDGESTTDNVFSGHSLVAENGELIAESGFFDNGLTVAEIDMGYLSYVRSKQFNQEFKINKDDYITVGFSAVRNGKATRKIPRSPFTQGECDYKLILEMQAQGLKKRILHTRAETVVLGLSGGLDSTLAAIVAVKAMRLCGKTPDKVIALTMPCFGTTSRTFDNSVKLARALGVTLRKVNIGRAVKIHLKDINHKDGVYDAAYENAQARERTQILMDISNMENGLVVGTGDLSELALGFATYNGDHISMYGVNAGIPKTLVRYIVKKYADDVKGRLKTVLYDILDTPVSPELLPAEGDSTEQKTEEIVGPYILHDFFLYNFAERGYSPEKIYYFACAAFDGEFEKSDILKHLKTFFRRFFNQQFKRSCCPDGVKVSPISLSPRGGLKMPSDAVAALWLNQLENL